MPKVLFAGVYRENSGWGVASRNYLRAMKSVGIDVVARPIILSQSNYQPDNEILELENKSSRGCDVIIQHCLPQQMTYSGHFRKCIGLFAPETSDFEHSEYTSHLNLMDEIWVPSYYSLEQCLASYVKPKVVVVPHAFNMPDYSKNYGNVDIPEVRGDFVFYFVGEVVRRKNLIALVKAFHTEFSYNEPVSLVIKGNRSGLNDEQCKSFITELCNTAKSNLKLYRRGQYKSEIVITGKLADQQLYALHQNFDCCVIPSYGEAFCQPLFDALAFGTRVIAPKVGGHTDYIDEEEYLVEGRYVNCFGLTESLPDIYTAREICYEVSVSDLRRKMRLAYENKDITIKNGKTRMFLLEQIGHDIVSLLEN